MLSKHISCLTPQTHVRGGDVARQTRTGSVEVADREDRRQNTFRQRQPRLAAR